MVVEENKKDSAESIDYVYQQNSPDYKKIIIIDSALHIHAIKTKFLNFLSKILGKDIIFSNFVV